MYHAPTSKLRLGWQSPGDRTRTTPLRMLILSRLLVLIAVAIIVAPGATPTVSYAVANQPTRPARQPTSSPTMVAIVGGRLIDGFGGLPLENSVVLVTGNRITAIGPEHSVKVPADARVIDANGMTVLPGLWESHGHLQHVGQGTPAEFLQRFNDRLPEIMAVNARINLMAGVTSFRDTGGPLVEQQALRQAIETGTPGPRLYLAGPIVNQRDRSTAHTPGDFSVGTVEEARDVATRLVAMKVDQVKVYGFWDEPVLAELVRTAHAAGIGVDADVRHVEAYRTAVKAGVDRLHHVFTADSLSDYSEEDLRLLVRAAKPIALGPSANILRGPYIVPTIEMRNAYARTLQYPEAVDHPRLRDAYPQDVYAYLRETWRNPQAIPWGIGAVERVKVAKRKLRRFIEAGGREQVVAGCDTGAPLNFHTPLPREIANLVEAGLTPLEAIQAATLRPAQMQGVDAELGSVSVGKLADLIVVDGDPLQDITLLQHRVVHVIKNGVVYR
jgi:imidazolonepropionase-like amidohydrolase